jgi:hypothetical protein
MVKMSHYFRDWGQPTLTIDWVSIWGQDKLGENPKHSETDGIQNRLIAGQLCKYARGFL